MGKLHAPFKTSSSFNHTQSSTFMLCFHRTFSKCTISVFQISGVGALSVSRTFLEKPKPSSKAKTLHGGAEPSGCGPCLPSPRKGLSLLQLESGQDRSWALASCDIYGARAASTAGPPRQREADLRQDAGQAHRARVCPLHLHPHSNICSTAFPKPPRGAASNP